MKIRDKQRLGYLAAFLLLVTAEVLIALLVHDAFIRPYFGDVLVVVVIYCFLRVLFPSGVRLLPLYVFLFAATIEGLQYFDLVHLLHLDGSRFFRTRKNAARKSSAIPAPAVSIHTSIGLGPRPSVKL